MATGACRPHDHHILTVRDVLMIDVVTVAIEASSEKEVRIVEVPMSWVVACKAKKCTAGPKAKVCVRGFSSAQILKGMVQRARGSLSLWLVEVKVVTQGVERVVPDSGRL